MAEERLMMRAMSEDEARSFLGFKPLSRKDIRIRLSRLEQIVATLSDDLAAAQAVLAEVQDLAAKYDALVAAGPPQDQVDAVNNTLAAIKSSLDTALNPAPTEPPA